MLLLELIAFSKARCFDATNTTDLLEYCKRLLDLYATCAAKSLGIDVHTKRALLGYWVLGATMLLSY